MPPPPAAEPSLKGRTVLITGASSGFGRVGALHYARMGRQGHRNDARAAAARGGNARRRGREGKARPAYRRDRRHRRRVGCRRHRESAEDRGRADRHAGEQCRHRHHRPGRGAGHGGDETDLRHQCLRHPADAARAAAADARGEKRSDFQHLVTARARHRAGWRPLFGDQVRGRSVVRAAGL